MSDYLTRTAQSRISARSGEHVLDWHPGSQKATIQIGESGQEFLAGWRPPRAASDLLLFGASVYCIDKTSPRRASGDAWTRDLSLRLPVADPTAFLEADWPRTLAFLTGDTWRLEPYASTQDPLDDIDGVPDSTTDGSASADAVCLFSGGLDSLCGAIDLLEADPAARICLVSHHEAGQASVAQQHLVKALLDHYGPDRVTSRRLYLRPAPANASQHRPLPSTRENTTRARSILFLTSALAIAAANGPDTPVYVPENGFIGVNVPLTRARVGTMSTRTTHPHFMNLLAESLRRVGVANPILNPYRLTTKGEMLEQSRNADLLRRLAPKSLSCAHPETARYAKRPQGNCGYCYPCLIRRASLHHVSWDTETYAWDVLTDPALLDPRTRRGADLRAVVTGVLADRPDIDALRNAPLPSGERTEFLSVWRRGRTELRSWINDKATGPLRAKFATPTP